MKSIKQEDHLGCAIACVAYLLNISYQKTLSFFSDGTRKAKAVGFTCKEIILVLNNKGLNYKYKYIKEKHRKKIYKPNAIVFLRRSRKYPAGHYLTRTNDKWMDSWINFPNNKIESGFRKKLPEKPIYLIYSS